MLKAFANLAILTGILVTAAHGQGLPDQLNFTRSNFEGPHLYGVSANSGYSQYDFRSSTGNSSGLTARTTYGVSATAGWQRLHGRTNFSIRYTGGYQSSSYGVRRNTMQHSLFASLTRSIGQKWTFGLSITGLEADLAQSLFEPSNLVLLTQSGASFDDLAASQSIGQYSSIQNGLLLGGGGATPAVRSLLLGTRVLTYNLDANVSYAATSRLTFSFGSFALGGQNRTNNPIVDDRQTYIMPRTIGGTADVSMSYSLSPRTTMSAGVGQTYTSTRYQKSTGTSPNIGIGRKMGRQWFLRGTFGVYINERTQQSVGTPPGSQATWSGSLGYQTRSHSLLATYNSAGLLIGDAAATIGRNTIYRGAWSWRPFRTAWNVHGNYSHVDTSGTGFVTLSGWQAGAGLNRNLGWNLVLSFNYAYVISSSNYLGRENQVNVNTARVSLGWAPHLRREQSGVLTDSDQ